MSSSSPTERAEPPQLVALMVAYQAGELGAFEQLYAALVEDVHRYFSRVYRDGALARDLVQDTFLELHRSRRTYAPPLPVRPWVFGIARHVLARSRRAAHARADAPAGEELDHDAAAADSAGHAPPGDALDLGAALSELPASTRIPWLLHHLFGFSFQSIAARLGVTVMAAKLRSSRAKRALRLALRAQPSCDDD
jgi:RNA polymerase sigma-70 factor (ECF subfamily)